MTGRFFAHDGTVAAAGRTLERQTERLTRRAGIDRVPVAWTARAARNGLTRGAIGAAHGWQAHGLTHGWANGVVACPRAIGERVGGARHAAARDKQRQE